MKYWPGNEVFPAGDNPPWNMFEMKTFGLSLDDDGSEGDVPTSEMLKGWMEPPGKQEEYTGWGGNILRLKADLSRIYNLYGAVFEMGSNKFGDPSYHANNQLYHRVHLLAGLSAENKMGDPTSFGLTEVPELIDNQPVGAAATTLTTPAVSYGAPNTGLIEVGFQCGKEFNGQYYPQVVDAIAVVSDQANVLMNCSIYKSYDGTTWFMVPKAQYNSNGWVNGEYLISNAWRTGEVGGITESARVFAFATPQLGCYFKIVYNNAAGKALEFNEIYGFNHQGEIGFTTDLVNYRYVKALKKGNQLLFNLKDAPIIRVGSGPIGPSGQRATLDEDTGIWRDFGADAWYDKGRWVRPDGKVWIEPTPFASGKWVTPAASLGAISVMDIAASRETLQTCRQIIFHFRPFNCSYDALSERLSVKLFSVYISTSQVDTYDSEGRKTNTMRFPSTAGQICPAIPFRIYNNGNQTSRGLEVWTDAQAVRPISEDGTTTAWGEIVSDGLSGLMPGSHSHSFFDRYEKVVNILNKSLSGLGSFGDSSVRIFSEHAKDDPTNAILEYTGTTLAHAEAWCAAWDTAYAAHIASTSHHKNEDDVNAMILPPPGQVLTDLIEYVNQAKAKFAAHTIEKDGEPGYVHYYTNSGYLNHKLTGYADAIDSVSLHSLIVKITRCWNGHVLFNFQGYKEVNHDNPDENEFHIKHTSGAIMYKVPDYSAYFGTHWFGPNSAVIYHYASPGSTICELSATGSDPWTTWPNILTHPNGVVPPRDYAIVYARSNLTGISEEVDRHTKIIARYNY